MSIFNLKWELKTQVQQEKVEALKNQINVSDTIGQLLIQRGIENYDMAKAFFNPSIAQLHNPMLMADMEKAVNRIEQSVRAKKRILIYGDYDVDGTTAVTLMHSFLSALSNELEIYVPDRYTEGYGLSAQGVQYAIDQQFDLVITLDCGIKATKAVAMLQAAGIDVIICDHHIPGEEPHPAFAVLNPKQEHCKYPFKELSGCGIGFKLAQAIAEKMGLNPSAYLGLLDLVAISSACDIVPMVGENRVLTSLGIQAIQQGHCRKSIAYVLGTKREQCTVTDLVFIVGPRINAAGRIAHAKHAVEFLQSDNELHTENITKQIEQYNLERRSLDQDTTQEALALIENKSLNKNKFSTIVYNEDWSKGVIGIAASRLIEHYYRPTIVLTKSNGKWVGSARSIAGFDVHQALGQCDGLLEQFGGHYYAAGLTLSHENLPAFVKKFEAIAESAFDGQLPLATLDVDTELPFSAINLNLIKVIERMAPFGPEHMTPIFFSKNVKLAKPPYMMGQEGKHAKLMLTQVGCNNTFPFVIFQRGQQVAHLQEGATVDIAYQLHLNHFNGTTSIQLMAKDLIMKH